MHVCEGSSWCVRGRFYPGARLFDVVAIFSPRFPRPAESGKSREGGDGDSEPRFRFLPAAL